MNHLLFECIFLRAEASSIMDFFSGLFNTNDSQQAHAAIYGSEPRHESSWTHELISGAAGFEGSIYNYFSLDN